MSKRGARKYSADARISVSLMCQECKNRNYKTTKRPDKDLQIKKFCKRCASHTVHIASK